jgi:hypothetical protein
MPSRDFNQIPAYCGERLSGLLMRSILLAFQAAVATSFGQTLLRSVHPSK